MKVSKTKRTEPQRPRPRHKQRTIIQRWNKRHGIKALSEAHKRLKETDKRHIEIAIHKMVKPVTSETELKIKLREMARRHPEAARVFVRGNPIERFRPQDRRSVAWASAPRAHYDSKRDQIIWDTTVQESVEIESDMSDLPKKKASKKWKEIEWILYPTQNHEDIKQEGIVFFAAKNGKATNIGHLPGNSLQRNAVRALVNELGQMITGKLIRLRYIEWKRNPGVFEFYDLNKQS